MPETNVVRAPIAPKKYVQGRGVLASLGRYVGEPGLDALAIAGHFANRPGRKHG